MTQSQPATTTLLLSLPRCGTHFFWTRYIASGRYQLIYDADRIPALKVLSEHCDRPLEFLYPPPVNPNYNFQYNSLAETDVPMTAAEHLGFLMAKYGAGNARELFDTVMDLQAVEASDGDSEGRGLLSINRFCYTIGYDWLLEDIDYDIHHALAGLDMLCDWTRARDPNTVVTLIVRPIKDWIDSLFLLWGPEKVANIARRLDELPSLLAWCQQRQVPVFAMGDAIRAVNAGDLDFHAHLIPMPAEALDAMAAEAVSCHTRLLDWPVPGGVFRVGRFVAYLREKDPILRTSLVRSLGTLPNRLGNILPPLGRRIRKDFDGEILNNARIKPID